MSWLAQLGLRRLGFDKLGLGRLGLERLGVGRLGLGRLARAERPGRVAPAAFEHVERLAEIHADAFARPWGPDEFEAFLADPAVRIDCLFAGRDRDPSGFAVSRATLDEAEILSFALARASRGRGCSTLLLRWHLHALALANVTRVHLEVEEGNLPAIALYRRARFVEVGRRPGYYLRPDGTRVSAISMTCRVGGAGDEPAGRDRGG